MDVPSTPVKPRGRSFAALQNVRLTTQLVNTLLLADPGTPTIGVLHGPSGYGKTESSIYAQNRSRARRIEVGITWTAKTLMLKILAECGKPKARGTISDLTDEVIIELGQYPDRPLFIDEADILCDKGLIDHVRYIYEQAQVPMLLIGEEDLPGKLKRIERVHNRVRKWVPAEPANLDDCVKLAALFAPGLAIADDLLDHMRVEGEGRVRRIVTSLTSARDWARDRGVQNLGLKAYGGDICDGRPPAPRNPKNVVKLRGVA